MGRSAKTAPQMCIATKVTSMVRASLNAPVDPCPFVGALLQTHARVPATLLSRLYLNIFVARNHGRRPGSTVTRHTGNLALGEPGLADPLATPWQRQLCNALM